MLRQVAGEADQRVGQGQGLAEGRIGGIEPRLHHMGVGQVLAPGTPDGVGDGSRHVVRKVKDLGHLPDRHARAIVDHRTAEGRPVPAVALVEVLDHLLPALVLEIDVDIRRLPPVL